MNTKTCNIYTYNIYVYVQIYRYIDVYTYTYIYMGTQQWVDGALPFRWACVCTFVHIKRYSIQKHVTYIHIISIYMYRYIDILMYIHICIYHIYIWARSSGWMGLCLSGGPV